LAASEVNDCRALKAQLLKRFPLTEGGYRKKFKTSGLNRDTPEQFIERSRQYLEKWREMAGFEQNHEGLENVVLRDQCFLACDKALQTFLKEKGKLSPKDRRLVIITRHMVIQLIAVVTKTTGPRARCMHMTMRARCTSVSQLTHLSEQSTVTIVG